MNLQISLYQLVQYHFKRQHPVGLFIEYNREIVRGKTAGRQRQTSESPASQAQREAEMTYDAVKAILREWWVSIRKLCVLFVTEFKDWD